MLWGRVQCWYGVSVRWGICNREIFTEVTKSAAAASALTFRLRRCTFNCARKRKARTYLSANYVQCYQRWVFSIRCGFILLSVFLGILGPNLSNSLGYFVALRVFSAFYFHFADATNLHGIRKGSCNEFNYIHYAIISSPPPPPSSFVCSKNEILEQPSTIRTQHSSTARLTIDQTAARKFRIFYCGYRYSDTSQACDATPLDNIVICWSLLMR